jgi:hypothetical protein
MTMLRLVFILALSPSAISLLRAFTTPANPYYHFGGEKYEETCRPFCAGVPGLTATHFRPGTQPEQEE